MLDEVNRRGLPEVFRELRCAIDKLLVKVERRPREAVHVGFPNGELTAAGLPDGEALRGDDSGG